MFSRIQTRRYRCLKAVDQTLGGFQALVGPNASGKTTFLDVIGLLSDLARNRGDVPAAIRARSSNFADLLWNRQEDSFQMAVEAPIPSSIVGQMAEDKRRYSILRYEVEIGLSQKTNEIGLNHETVWLREPANEPKVELQRELFPFVVDDTGSILSKSGKGFKAVITKKPGGNDNFYTEGKKSYMPSFRLGRTKSALSNIPADRESFPVSSWFRDMLETGVQTIVLNSQVIRQPSPPGLGFRFLTDGSNLPWVIDALQKDEARYRQWLAHVRTALEDVTSVTTVERPEDRHRYLVVEYESGARVPSWLVSDGTLRLLALTIPPYLRDMQGVFMIEEPENGIHPRAIETILQSLSSMYGSQVLIATHSPVALAMLAPKDVLCFAKDNTGATDIVSGSNHPALRDWQSGQPDLGVLFASGILS
jgi:predicted ATPase